MYLLHRSVGPSVQFLYSGCMIAAKFRIMTIEQRAVRGTAENFVICDTQKSYSENLFRRLSEKLSGYFQFHVFHDIENLKIAAKSMQVNILLIGEEYGKEDRDEIPARQKYLLIGEKIPNERSPTEIPFFRYQSVSSMLELLLQEKVQENSEVQTNQIQLVSDSESKCKWSDRDLFTGSSNREDKVCHAYGTSSFRIDSYVVSESGRVFRIKLLPAGRIRNESWRSAVLHEAGKYQSGMEDQYFDQPYEWVGLYRTDPGRTRFQRSDKRRMESTFGSDSGEEYLQSDHS